MEIEELKMLWQQYDDKLTNLERLNKKMIWETLSKKPQKRLYWIQTKLIYAILVTPVFGIILYNNFFAMQNFDTLMLLGGLLTISVLVLLMFFYLKSLVLLMKMNVKDKSIYKTARQAHDYKNIIIIRQKYLWFAYPILLIGLVMVERNSLNLNIEGYIFLAGLLIFIYIIGYGRFKFQSKEANDIEKEIIELKEFLK